MTSQEIISIRDYFDERIRSHEEYDRELWRRHEAVHKVERLQIETASRVQDERLERMNEFRDQISSERLNYITRSEVMWAFGAAIMIAGVVGGFVSRLIVAYL